MKFINALVVKLIDTKDQKLHLDINRKIFEYSKEGYLDCNLNKQYLLSLL